MRQSLPHEIRPGELVTEKSGEETKILGATSDEFVDCQIMNLKAPAGSAPGVLIANRHEALAPALRQSCGRLVHTMRVVTEGLVKKRTFADRALDEDGIAAPVARKDSASTEVRSSLGASG